MARSAVTLALVVGVALAHSWYFVTATDFAGNEGDAAAVDAPTPIDPDIEALPTPVPPDVHALRVAGPNPFGHTALLAIDLPEPGPARVSVFDSRGRMVARLVEETLAAGRYRVAWRGRNANGVAVAPGVYFVQFEARGFTAGRRLIRVR